MSNIKQQIIRTSIVASMIMVAVIVAWVVTRLIFSAWTDSGEVYVNSISPLNGNYSERLVTLYGEEEFYMRRWDADTRVSEFDVYIGGTLALTLAVGDLEDISSYAFREHSAKCSFDEKIGYGVFWQFSGTATRNLREVYGVSSINGCRLVAAFTNSLSLLPYARDVHLEIPRGAMNPLISLLIDRGMKGLNTTADSKAVEALTSRLVDEVTDRLQLEKLAEDIKKIAFLYGPVQWITLFFLNFCIALLILSIPLEWARPVTEGVLDLIPYVGFFGTLLGMGAALSILGEANLSDPISKAINLGPIGSKLSLAIETTKFALVCFGVGTLLVLLRDVVKVKEKARANPLISAIPES